MPIYEYECESCRNIFEVTQRISDDPLSSCPDCAGSVKKLVSRSSFQLKGGGWYADGYNNGSGGCEDKSKSCPAASAGGESSCAKASGCAASS